MTDKELPEYRCHKTVRAIKISALEIHKDKSATINSGYPGYIVILTRPGWAETFKGGSDDTGYYMVYVDGYTSWSPSKAFEDGYTLV